MKKLLSVVLALALCLTAMMGCFAVSAETVATKATINIAGGEAIKAGETATVTVTGSDFTDVCAADLVITLPAGFELVSVSEAGEVLVNDENGVYYVYNETANTVKYIDVFNFNDEVKDLDLALVVTAPADAEDGEYAVTGAVVAANIDEEFLGVTINNGAITVQNEVLPPEPTPITLTYQHSLNLQSKILINNYVLVNDELSSCAAVYMDCTKITANGNNTVTLPSTIATVGGQKYFWFQYDDVPAAELGVTFTSYVYGVDEEGNVIYESANNDSYSALDYLGSKMAASNTAPAMKTLFADIVNYAAAAQINFGYDVDNLATNDPRVVDLVPVYQSSQNALADLVDSTAETGSGFTGIQNSLALDSSVKLSFAWPKAATKSYDASSLRVVLEYNGKTKEYAASDIQQYNASYDCVYFDELGAPDFGDVIDCTIYSGDTAISATKTYSIESFCANRYNRYHGIVSGACTESLYNLTQALMRYSRQAAVIFG